MNGRRAGESPDNAIDVDENDLVLEVDREVVEIGRRVRNYQPQKNRSLGSQASDGVDEEKYENLASEALAGLIDLTIDDEPIVVRRSRKRRPRPQREIPQREHERFQYKKLMIKVNTLYELDPEQTPPTAVGVHFIKVNTILENLESGEIKICGMPFCRSRTLTAKLPRKLNEIFCLLEIDADDDRPAEIQSRIEVSAAALIRPRALHLTNAPYPEHRYMARAYCNYEVVEKEGPLVCRWNYFIHYRDWKMKVKGKAYHWTLERVRASEVKREDHKVEEDKLRQDWRGLTVQGGSHLPETSDGKQRYTVFDSFCGAGGFSRGAERAGLHVQFAVDHWEKACDSYRLNFPETKLYQTSVDEFILSHTDIPMRADILHLSPPCQTWSPAHTIPGVNDEANIAALFACRSLVERLRPRIFTLEQTFGILQGCHDPFFCSLVGGFTDFGYSVTWKIVHLQTWGLPQTRKRLIMIGSCPGEKLPPFPTATHSETGFGGLSKYVTIRQALRKITDDSTFHNPDEEITDSPPPSGSVVSDPDQILKRCVTCSGGQNRHYSNTRAYTVREFASLQGFPVWHKFSPASKAVLKKQIGNAFPACVVKLLCEHLKNWLLEVDGLAASRPGRASVGGRELIFVSEGPRQPSPLELVQPLLLPMGVDVGGGSLDQAIMLNEDEQCEIKFDIDSDIEMEDVPVPDVPDSPRSATLSLPGTPEPPQAGCVRDLPIFID
ncbi:DNA (cytosine-5)-methyltransferase PliMCI [Colletotrichum gloeosporioides]|uniref:DNA (cytosine-5-)-methyltransferase n=1 Tax=Colletotrichum gloeosporioides TaxID=474922 RepID=A0A8H4C4T3_COLGL|nr:DNA (cytosine-5)-methyltransferase PliMCI [Colletotrichum gloeosporioides]KAF3797365.1 DNA (cytosine-5)-methyltransferase PliMCI [Colletotrichum gloeosporioides]